jgi:hypothetical protein
VSSGRFSSAFGRSANARPAAGLYPTATILVRAATRVALTPQSQAHRGPFAQDWNNDSKTTKAGPKHHALGYGGKKPRRRCVARRIASTGLAEQRRCRSTRPCTGGMKMSPHIFLAWLEQIQQSLR